MQLFEFKIWGYRVSRYVAWSDNLGPVLRCYAYHESKRIAKFRCCLEGSGFF